MKKLTIRCWTGLYPWLCPCRCRRFLLLLLRLFASRRRSLLGFSSAPKTPMFAPNLPGNRCLFFFVFCFFAARTNSLASSLLLPLDLVFFFCFKCDVLVAKQL